MPPYSTRQHVVAVLSAAVLCVACHAPPHRPHRAVAAASADAPVTAADPGAAVLAAVDNARGALALNDRVAALNSVSEALADVIRLPDTPSNIYPNDVASPGGGKHGHPADAAIGSFDLQVKLISAKAELDSGDARGADADLAAIDAGTPARLIPSQLPLLRAGAALAQAQAAADYQRIGQLKTDLRLAAQCLATYGGTNHAGDARSLASAIRAELARPGALQRLQPALLSSWSGQVGGWA
jgi:hypothetical protein